MCGTFFHSGLSRNFWSGSNFGLAGPKILPDLVLGPKTAARCGPTRPDIVRWPKLVAAKTSFLDQMPISTGRRTNLPQRLNLSENLSRVLIGMIELARVEIRGQACHQKMKILTS